MVKFLVIILEAAFVLITLLALSFLISSIWEKEKRASLYAGILFAITLILFTAFLILNRIHFFDAGIGFWILILGLISIPVLTLLLLLPVGGNPDALKGTQGLIIGDIKRVDERDTVFSRIYRQKIEAVEEKPAEPGVSSKPVSKSARAGRSPNLAMARASDTIASKLAGPDTILPPVSDVRTDISPEDATVRVKGFAKRLGAVLVGITELNPLWIYSHRGKSGVRSGDWGADIQLDHRYAIVFAVEMDFDIIGASPLSPTIMESLQKYAKGAYISGHLAQFIANMGWQAKSNQMARYDTMVVPLAIDAGLGELSRMGYLITKEYGPRVRLGAVTTNIPLIPDKPVDIGIVDFCGKCLKCAHCCPSNSIPLDKRTEVNGSLRWVIDTDTCHEYWHKIGTDCAICMRVCPWSHAKTLPHKLITEAVSRNSISRTLFARMDDLFYGVKPPVKSPPAWAGFHAGENIGVSDDLID